jgi:hypothetical protein
MALLSDETRGLSEPLPYGTADGCPGGAVDDPFPNEPSGPCLLSTGAAGAWSLTRRDGRVVLSSEAAMAAEAARAHRQAMRLEAKARGRVARQRRVFCALKNWVFVTLPKMKKIVMRLMMLQAAKMLNYWKEYTAKMQMFRVRLKKIVNKWLLVTVRRTWNGWIDWVAMMHKMRRMIATMKQAQLMKAFKRWGANVSWMRTLWRPHMKKLRRVLLRVSACGSTPINACLQVSGRAGVHTAYRCGVDACSVLSRYGSTAIADGYIQLKHRTRQLKFNKKRWRRCCTRLH